jgi:hypothetical protein
MTVTCVTCRYPSQRVTGLSHRYARYLPLRGVTAVTFRLWKQHKLFLRAESIAYTV